MKVHLTIDQTIVCTPNVGRLTTRRERMNKRPSAVTCTKCRQVIDRFKPEYVARLESEATTKEN